MVTVVVHFEFKQGARLGLSGPGDTLRLAHAISHPEFANERLIVLTTSTAETLGEFIAGRHAEFKTLDPDPNIAGLPSGTVDARRIAELVEANVPTAMPIRRLVHAFIGQGGDAFRGVDCPVYGQHLRRFRIDSSTPELSCMFHRRWSFPIADRCHERVLGVTRRNECNLKCRNAPSWFCNEVRGVAMTAGWKVRYLGGESESPCPIENGVNESFFPWRGHTLAQQVGRIAATVKAAVGWNSGGLDLAAAADIPILRFGEFQGRGSWGVKYNSYLGTGGSIGLRPTGQRSEDYPVGLFQASLHAFLSNIENIPANCHVILPEGRPLLEMPELQGQLDSHAVPWVTRSAPPVCW